MCDSHCPVFTHARLIRQNLSQKKPTNIHALPTIENPVTPYCVDPRLEYRIIVQCLSEIILFSDRKFRSEPP